MLWRTYRMERPETDETSVVYNLQSFRMIREWKLVFRCPKDHQQITELLQSFFLGNDYNDTLSES